MPIWVCCTCFLNFEGIRILAWGGVVSSLLENSVVAGREGDV